MDSKIVVYHSAVSFLLYNTGHDTPEVDFGTFPLWHIDLAGVSRCCRKTPDDTPEKVLY